jgi:hypothetical protein
MLNFSDLPATHQGPTFSIEAHADMPRMEQEFIQIMQGTNWLPDMPCFKHMMPVAGLPGSCRLLLDKPYPGSVPLPNGMTQREMADELYSEQFLREARFPTEPTSADGGTFDRCYEVRRLVLNKRPAVLVFTGWKPRKELVE